MTFRMLIVDDEAPIADGLQDVFRALPGLELDVYKAYSGMDALRILEGGRIDIVLSDVRMPGMSGLELLDQIKKRWPECRVIFLTGHNDFEYIYAAVRHEGVSYLLKMENIDTIIGAVEKAAVEIENGIEAGNLVKAANRRMVEARDLMRESFLLGLLEGRIEPEEIVREKFDELGIPLNASVPALLLLGRIENMPAKIRHSEKYRRIYGIQSIADQYFRERVAFARVSDGRSLLFWMIQPVSVSGRAPEPGEWDFSATYVKGVAEFIQAFSRDKLGLALSLSLDAGPSEWGGLPDRAASLRMLLHYGIGESPRFLLADKGREPRMLLANRGQADCPEWGPLRAKVGSAPYRLSLERLGELLEYGSRKEYFDCLDDLTAGLSGAGNARDLLALERYSAIALVLLSWINKRTLVEKLAPRASLHKLTSAESHGDWAEAASYLRRLSELVFEVQEADRELLAKNAVDIVRGYILEHIEDPDELTLVRLADVVHFNPSYLSRLFKQVAGANISDHIAEAKIRRAKILLDDPEAKVQEVARSLGYGTATNFTRFFKKITNLTPQEYRDRSGKGSSPS